MEDFAGGFMAQGASGSLTISLNMVVGFVRVSWALSGAKNIWKMLPCMLPWNDRCLEGAHKNSCTDVAVETAAVVCEGSRGSVEGGCLTCPAWSFVFNVAVVLDVFERRCPGGAVLLQRHIEDGSGQVGGGVICCCGQRIPEHRRTGARLSLPLLSWSRGWMQPLRAPRFIWIWRHTVGWKQLDVAQEHL